MRGTYLDEDCQDSQPTVGLSRVTQAAELRSVVVHDVKLHQKYINSTAVNALSLSR